MSRLRYSNSIGLLGASLSSSGTTITFQYPPSFATITGSDYIPLTLDPPSGATPNSAFEIVYLTAYTAGATTGTITRAQEGTTGVAHASGVVWMCAPVAADFGQTWTALAYNSNWADYATSSLTGGAYMIDGFNTVHLRGVVKTTSAYGFGAGTATIATLPAGYRCAVKERFGAVASDTGTGNTTFFVDVTTDGKITIVTAINGGSASGTMSYLSLSGISFQQGN